MGLTRMQRARLRLARGALFLAHIAGCALEWQPNRLSRTSHYLGSAQIKLMLLALWLMPTK